MRVLTINAGSSSLKLGVFALSANEPLIVAAEIERIGSGGVSLHVTSPGARSNLTQAIDAADHAAALDVALDALEREPAQGEGGGRLFDAVAHRIVHGGSKYATPQLVDADLLDELRRLIPIDPNHLPQALSLIDAVTRRHAARADASDIPQIACFDTAFHRTLPRVAQMYALPPRFWDAGVRRYGFHGLSCEFIIDSLGGIDRAAAAGRVIIAHLGNGASLTAVRDGKSVETTMGFSPAGGIVMGTRLGDVDPSVLVYALQQEQMTPEALSRLVNAESGLRGVSQTSHDMRDLLSRESSDPRAADAVALFCHAARKSVGALAAVLGGLDTMIFTGGIGEHAAPIRERICAGLEFFGIALDVDRNAEHAPIISRADAPVTIRVMKTDEDRMLARHARRVLQHNGVGHV